MGNNQQGESLQQYIEMNMFSLNYLHLLGYNPIISQDACVILTLIPQNLIYFIIISYKHMHITTVIKGNTLLANYAVKIVQIFGNILVIYFIQKQTHVDHDLCLLRKNFMI